MFAVDVRLQLSRSLSYSDANCQYRIQMVVYPIINREAHKKGRPVTPPDSPYAGIRDMIFAGAQDGDVIGFMVGRLSWESAGLKLNSRLSTGMSESFHGTVRDRSLIG